MQIYDGRNVSANRLAELTGYYDYTDIASMIYRSSGPELLVRMTTDSSVTNEGFVANYQTTQSEFYFDI